MFRCLGAAAALAAAMLVGCGSPPLTCAEVDLACAPQYAPTYDNVFDNTLDDDCSSSACHDSVNPKGELDLSERETAYQALIDRMLVIPGQPSCSEMVDRIFTTESAWHMPRGDTLAESEQCAIALWVANGALRADTPDAGMMPDASP